MRGRVPRCLAGLALVLAVLFGGASAAAAAPAAAAPAAEVVAAPVPPRPAVSPSAPTVSVDVNGTNVKPTSSLTILLALTLLSVAPALLLCTSFTKIFVVLGITRNALGLTTVPPNQVLAGLALFLTMFIMGPTLSDMNSQGVQPYIKGDKTQSVAFKDGVEP